MSVFKPENFLFYFRPGSGWAAPVGGELTFSRPSTKTRVNRYRQIEEVDDGAPARNWVEENGVLRPATRLEAARTNSLTRSEEFDHADWTKTGVSITADGAVAPDGTTTADKIVEDGSTGVHTIEQNSPSLPASATQISVSFFFKEAERSWAYIRLRGTPFDGTGPLAYFDLANGSVGTTLDGTSSTLDDALIESIGNGWYRCSIVATSDGSSGNATATASPTTGDNTLTYSGDGSSGIYVWGAQLEGVSGGASFPSSYISTGASAVSRSADGASTGIGFGPQELTVYVKYIYRGFRSTFQTYLQVGDESSIDANNNLIVLDEKTSTEFRALFWDGSGSPRSTMDSGFAPSLGDVVEQRIELTQDSIQLHASVNGGPEIHANDKTHGGFQSSFADGVIAIGQRAQGDRNVCADFLSILIAPGVKTMDEMRALAGEA